MLYETRCLFVEERSSKEAMRAASLTHRVETLRAGESGHREKFAFSTGHPVRLSQREQATDGPGAFFEMGEEGGDLNRKC